MSGFEWSLQNGPGPVMDVTVGDANFHLTFNIPFALVKDETVTLYGDCHLPGGR